MEKKKSPYVFLTCLALSVIAVVGSTVTIYDDFRLATRGVRAVATVEQLVSQNKTKQGRVTYTHRLTVDGRRTTLNLEVGYPEGRQIVVTYLPDDPTVIKGNDLTRMSVSEVLWSGYGPMAWLISLFLFFITYLNYRDYRNVEPEDDE